MNEKKIFFDVLVGPCCDLKTAFLIKNLLKVNKRKNYLVNFENFGFQELDFKHFFCFNNEFVIFNDLKVKGSILFGFDPKKEVSILNLRLRKRFLKGDFFLINFGTRISLTIPVTNIGSNNFNFKKIISGNHFFCKILCKKVKKVLIVGNTFLSSRFLPFSQARGAPDRPPRQESAGSRGSRPRDGKGKRQLGESERQPQAAAGAAGG